MQLLGERASDGRIAREEELDDVARDLHAAGGVQARREAEAYVGRGDGARGVDAGKLHQRAQTGLRWAAELAQTNRSDGAVFVGERNGVRNGGNGEQLEK